MRVNRIFIESYGERSNETLDFSQGNLRLIYGRNEAGKSTLLNFIRDILFGLPKGNDRSSLFGEEVVGGSIEFQLQDGREGRVSQKWSHVGKKSGDEFYASIRNLQSGVDDVLERDAFQALLGGADRDLFARYFGFTHQDLIDNKALTDKSSLDRLVYGMILGGAERLEAVKAATSKRCDELFLPRGSKKRINDAIRRLQEAKKASRSSDSGTNAYRTALDERDEAAARVVELKARCDDARRNFLYWKTLDDARDAFERFCACRESYDAFLAQTRFDPETLARFDESQENDYARWKELRDASDGELPGLESEAKAELESLRRLDASRSSIVDYERQITDLARRVALIDKTRDDLPELERKLLRDKNALLVELQTLGLAPVETTDEALDEVVKLRRAPILESVFYEIDDLAKEENLLESKIAGLNAALIAARGDLERRTQVAKDLRREFVEKFGGETRLEDAKTFVEINENFVGLKKDADNLTNREGELDELRRSNDEKLRALVVQVCGSDVDDATFQEFANSLNAENVAAPLNAQFDDIKNKDDAASAKFDDLQKESQRLDREIAEFELQIQQAPEDVVSVETLNERRDKRRALWDSFKNALLVEKRFDAATLEKDVDVLERLTREIDALADRRYERAEAVGKLEEQRRKRDELSAQKTKVDGDLKLVRDAREALQNRARELWRRSGLERCAALSIAAGQEWLENWATWREGRAEILHKDATLKKDRGAIVDKLGEAFEAASRWVESEAFEVNSLDKAVRVIEKTLKSARERVGEYRELVGKIDAQRNESAATEQKIAESERELARANDERKALSTRLDNFCCRCGYEYEPGIKNPCAQLKTTLQRLCDWQKKFGVYDEQDGNFQAEKERIRDFETQVDELKKKLQETLVCERAEDYVANWERRLKDASAIEKNWNFAQQTYAAKNKSFQTKLATRNGYDAKLAEIEEKSGVAREAFAAFRKDAGTCRELTNSLAQESRILREKLGAKNDEAFKKGCAELANVDSGTVRENCERFKREAEEYEGNYEAASAKRGELDGRLKTLENEGNPALLNSRYQAALSELREAVDVYAPTLFARRALEDSLRICKEEKIPEILEYARGLFRNVTSGRYSRIEEIESNARSGRGSKLEKESPGFRVVEQGIEKSKTYAQLSSGTREQLYLALRLAHIRQYCRQAEPLPIWADDVLLSASCERVGKLIEALKNFADEGCQVVLSTCQASTLRTFKEIVGSEYVTILKPRKIRR